MRRSILFDSKADLLVFGMGERPIMEVADRMRRGERIQDIRDVRGTAYTISDEEMRAHEADPAKRAADRKTVVLPSFLAGCGGLSFNTTRSGAALAQGPGAHSPWATPGAPESL